MRLVGGEVARGLRTIWTRGETAADCRASRACTYLGAKLAELAGGFKDGEERSFQTVAAGSLAHAQVGAS